MVQSSGFPTPMDRHQHRLWHEPDAGPRLPETLSANHKGALAAMVAELGKYAGWSHSQSGVYPALGSVSHRQTVGAWHRNQDEISFQWSEPVFEWSGSEAGRLMEGDVKLRFHLCQLRLNDAIYMSLSSQRHNEEKIASYPTVRSEIRTFSMQNNLTRFDIPNLFQNRIPDRLIVGLLDSRAFNGDVTRDPFCFQKFGLTSIKQIVKGEEYPYETLQLVHNNGTRDNLGYFRFLQASGAWCKKKGNMVELLRLGPS